MIQLPLPPKKPATTSIEDVQLNEYLRQVELWQGEMIRVLQSVLNDLQRNYDRQSEPVSVPGATRDELASNAPRFKPALGRYGDSRLVMVTDGDIGTGTPTGVLCYADGDVWRTVDGRLVVTVT